MGFFRNLHPAIKAAFWLFIAEAIFAPLGNQLFETYSGPVFDMLASIFEYFPHGLLVGTAIGIVGSLYLLRGRTKDWYKRFDKTKSEYRDQTISIASLMREYIDDDGSYKPVRKKDFSNCVFEGPGMFVFMDDLEVGRPNKWEHHGKPLMLHRGDTLTGCIGFQGCRFDGCKFRHITPIMSPELLESVLSEMPEGARDQFTPFPLRDKITSPQAEKPRDD